MQEIIKQIDELQYDTNQKLIEIREELRDMTGEDKKYEMSAKDAWDLAAGICLARPTTLLEIFDMSDPANIFVCIDPEVAKCLWDTYFHKNEKTEEETLEPGDRVDFVRKNGSKTFPNWIFVGEDNQYYLGILKNTTNAHYFDKGAFTTIKRKD